MKKYLILLSATVFPFTAFAQTPAPAPPSCTASPRDFSSLAPSVAKKYKARDLDMQSRDKNCDGILQADELKQGLQNNFAAADINHDGIISPDEQAALIRQFEKDNSNKEGVIVQSRAQKLENLNKNLDKNKDGVISQDEYESFYQNRYQKFDKDKDGSLDLKEYELDTESGRQRHRDDH